MSELTNDEAILAIVDSDPDFEGKTIPYLGWFWRDWDYGRLSLTRAGDHGRVAIDAAGKWDYPSCAASEEDRLEILRLLAEMGRSKQRVLDILERYRSQMKAQP